MQTVLFFLFPLCMLYVAVSDLDGMIIPNRVPVALVMLFVVVAPMAGLPWTGFLAHLAVGMLVLTMAFGLFAAGILGGGDAKLIAATSLWLGYGPALAEYVVAFTVIGGVFTLAILLYRRSPLALFTGHLPLLRHVSDSRAGVPYGVALTAGGLVAYPSSELAAGLWLP